MIRRLMGTCAVIAVAGAWHSAMTQPQTAPREVRTLTFDAASGGLTVRVGTSQPVPSFRCSVTSGAPREVLLEVPEAASLLESLYHLDDLIVREVRVESGIGPSGVRIRFVLGAATFTGIEQSAQGLVLQFAPGVASDGPSGGSPDYLIGVGDKLEIVVFGHEDMNRTAEVRGDGTISLPMIGNIRVSGRTASEADAEITRILSKDYLVDPEVNVEIKESQSQWVSVLGEIRNPGKFLFKRNMRVIDLLAEAGGPTKEAGSDIIITHRTDPAAEPEWIVVNRERLFRGEAREVNLSLAPGDIVTVSEKEVFYIRGEVAKPGPYFLESGMTVLKAITFAGGLSQFANRKDITLLRSEKDRVQEKLRVNLKAIEEGKRPDIPLRPNDLIIVPRRIF